MRTADHISTARAALRSHPLRTCLAIIGIVIGTASVVITAAIGTGTQRAVQEEIEALGTRIIQIYPGSVTTVGVRGGTGSSQRLTDLDAERLSTLDSAEAVVPVLAAGRVTLVNGSQNWTAGGIGATGEFFKVRNWYPDLGREFTSAELASGLKVVILGRTTLEKLGAQFVEGMVVRINNLPFRVIGVLSEKGSSISGVDLDDFVVVPLNAARRYLVGRAPGVARAVSMIAMKVREDVDIKDAEEEISNLMLATHRTRENAEATFRIQNTAELQRTKANASNSMTAMLTGIALVSLLVGGIGIANVLLMSVFERTREIGLRMAIGASEGDIRTQFLLEAVLLAFIGAMGGVLLGVSGAAAVDSLLATRTEVTIGPVILSVLCSGAAGLIAGLYPALLASKMMPADALRSFT